MEKNQEKIKKINERLGWIEQFLEFELEPRPFEEKVLLLEKFKNTADEMLKNLKP